jgi:hypothetical protein
MCSIAQAAQQPRAGRHLLLVSDQGVGEIATGQDALKMGRDRALVVLLQAEWDGSSRRKLGDSAATPC